MTPEELADRVGRMSDTCSNLLGATKLVGLPDRMHVEGLTSGLKRLRSELNGLFRELGGTEPLDGDEA